jgi:clan AA aspartic protease
MILGNVRNREAFLELEVHGNEKRLHRGEVLIDTGFNGYLTLPGQLVSSLKLTFTGHRRGTLADGSVTRLNVYLARIDWHGDQKEILVLESNGTPLLGMSLLEGNRMSMDVVDGGEVTITELP